MSNGNLEVEAGTGKEKGNQTRKFNMRKQREQSKAKKSKGKLWNSPRL
jgi:hypothetical protein